MITEKAKEGEKIKVKEGIHVRSQESEDIDKNKKENKGKKVKLEQSTIKAKASLLEPHTSKIINNNLTNGIPLCLVYFS